MAAAVLTSVRRETCTSLTLWHLTEAGFSLLAESLHALSTTPVLDDEPIQFLSEPVIINALFVTSTTTLSLLALAFGFASLARILLLLN